MGVLEAGGRKANVRGSVLWLKKRWSPNGQSLPDHTKSK